MRFPVPRVILLVSALLAVVPAAASAKPAPYPKVKSVSPLRVSVGQTMTLRGSGFRSGKARNTVVFKRNGKPAIFVRSARSTKSKLRLVVPAKLLAFLTTKATVPQPTRFRLRVLALRFSKSFTSTKLSPLVVPPGTTAPGTVAPGGPGTPHGGTPAPAPVPPTPYQRCEAAAAAAPKVDSDADGLLNGAERSAGTDACNADSDGDGMLDGYEWDSARDLNGFANPYPGKRPWPNPLDPGDANYDFDGDGLTLAQEYALWSKFSNGFPVIAYSDGTQNSGGTMPANTSARVLLDLDGDGNLTDDERDADGDGLSNVVEDNYRGTQGWWQAMYKDEKPYTARPFIEPDPLLRDSDGDGIPDGADDQDVDGYDNFVEMQISREQSGLRTQPFNPCLPNPHALTCSRYAPFESAWAPFDGSQSIGDAIPFLWPRPAAQPATGGWDGDGGRQGP
jgi:hypothetical protein